MSDDPLGDAIALAVADSIADACAERDCFTDTDPVLATPECVCYNPATYRRAVRYESDDDPTADTRY
jgi:hypothetical protein